MDWRYTDGPAIDWSGWAEDDIADTTVQITLSIGSDARGHATMYASACSVSIGSLAIHLHGSGGQFFQDIANLARPLIQKAAQDAIASHMKTGLNTLFDTAFQLIPVEVPLLPNTALYYGLIPTAAQRGLAGKYYSHDCIFTGDASNTVLTDFGYKGSAYTSLDVSGYVRRCLWLHMFVSE